MLTLLKTLKQTLLGQSGSLPPPQPVSRTPQPVSPPPLSPPLSEDDLADSLFVVSGRRLQGDETPVVSPSHLDFSSGYSLQYQLETLPEGDTLTLFPPQQEYQSPLIIDRPVVLDGQGATIWGRGGTVVALNCDRITLKNCRIELTEPNPDSYAIQVQPGCNVQFENVEVRGMVTGIPSEAGVWDYPESINLGQLAWGCDHSFKLRVVVPVTCDIIAEIAGVEFFPRHLQPGVNGVTLLLENLPQDTLIFGSVFLVSDSLKRRMTVTGHILSLPDGKPHHQQLIWEAKTIKTTKSPSLSQKTVKPRPTPPNPPTPSPVSSSTPSPKIRRQQTPNLTASSWLVNEPTGEESGTSSPEVGMFATSPTGTSHSTTSHPTSKSGKPAIAVPDLFLQEDSPKNNN
ncbi:hypothetical protein PN462_08390 [Spirulina sp. CS-785/01]|uniref:hypothetical protein n=1 Tax=Spirulina sp. CS-785/01 TaxID=3021716 RepID=UPI00232C90B4|nr:hypothetical protein [Spirulina sp. CS-785/01]MDB9313117.1 hypothetical protein [Spirulina sp. CS-785/01]